MTQVDVLNITQLLARLFMMYMAWHRVRLTFKANKGRAFGDRVEWVLLDYLLLNWVGVAYLVLRLFNFDQEANQLQVAIAPTTIVANILLGVFFYNGKTNETITKIFGSIGAIKLWILQK